MGDIGETIWNDSGALCFHLDRPSPELPCPRCHAPGEPLERGLLEFGSAESLTTESTIESTALARLSARSRQVSVKVPALGRVFGREAPAAPAQLTAPKAHGMMATRLLAKLSADHTWMAISTAREISEGLQPVASEPVVVAPGERREIELWTGRAIGGPYRIGIATSSETHSMRVRSLRIGNELLNLGVGEIASQHLELEHAEWPEGLVPVKGPVWLPGLRLVVVVVNTACFSDEVTLTVWGHPAPSEEEVMRRLQPGAAITVQRAHPVVGSTFELRTAPEASHVAVVNTEAGTEIRLSHEDYEAEHDQWRRKLKHLWARIKQLNEHVDEQRGRAEDLERQLRKSHESKRMVEGLHALAVEEHRQAQQVTHPATVCWFGPSWMTPMGARVPLCDETRASVPMHVACGKVCPGCGREIEPGDSGFSLSRVMASCVFYHRQCWFVEIGAAEPEPGSALALENERWQARQGAFERYREDEQASRALAERRPVEDDDGWGAWSSATDEDP